MQTPDTPAAPKIPQSMSEHIDLLKDAFHSTAKLKHIEADALKLFTKIEKLVVDRNRIIHGHWEPFNQTIVPSADVVWLKRAETRMGLAVDRLTISSDLLHEYAYQASNLNMEMLRFSRILEAERGPPPPDACKL